MNVALDANVLIADPWLGSQRMRALLDYVTKTRSYIVLHEVVELEVKAHHKRTFAEDARKVQTILTQVGRRGLMGLPEFDQDRVSDETFTAWERHFHDVLGPNLVYRVPSTGHHYEEAVRRAIERVPPCSNSREGIRDAIIWLDLLEMSRFPSKIGRVAFVSENTKDFAQADKRSLREELAQDLSKYEAEITYFSSLQRFLKAHVEPVGHITREWLMEHTYFGEIEEELRTRMAYGAYNDSFHATGSLYADYYVPIGRPDITSVDVHLDDFYVWMFNDSHTEITFFVDAHVEADIECMRSDAPPISSYGEDHYMEVSQYRNRTLSCYADLEFEVVADVEGDEVSFRHNEGVFGV